MLIDDVGRYIALRRSLGFKLKETAKNLDSFCRFAEGRGERYVRTVTAAAWPRKRRRQILGIVASQT